MSAALRARLICHRATPASPVRGIEVEVNRAADGSLALTYRIDGNLDRVRIPAPRPSRLVNELWRHTCLEAFIALDSAAAYHELNFSPSGEWAAYAFRAYRDAAPLDAQGLTPRITVRSAADRLELDALVALDRLSPEYRRAPLSLGLSAVIEDSDGALSYWALAHPSSQPDFHHLDTRVLRLEPPSA